MPWEFLISELLLMISSALPFPSYPVLFHLFPKIIKVCSVKAIISLKMQLEPVTGRVFMPRTSPQLPPTHSLYSFEAVDH